MATDPAYRRTFDTTTAVVEGAADGLADGIDEQGLDRSVPGLVRDTAPIAQRGIRSERLRATLDKADERVSQAIAATRTKARAVAESARRARQAPGHLAEDVKLAAKSYVGGITASLGTYLAAGLVAAATFVLLTVGAVQGLNDAWGAPRGTFAVALAYGVLAVVLAGVAKGKARAGKERARMRLAKARLELHSVAAPVRQAFRGEPRATSTFGQLKDTTALATPPSSTPSGPLTAIPSAPPTETFPGRDDR